MSKAQSAKNPGAKSTPAPVKAAGASKSAPKGTHQLPAGTITGEQKKLEQKPEVEITEEQRAGERRQQQADAAMRFAGQQLSAPAAHQPELTPEQKKMAEYKAAAAKLAADMGVTLPPEPVAPAPKAAKNSQNGITRPAQGTTTGKVWAAADEISLKQNGAPAQIAQMKDHPAMKGMNDHTLRTQYARWRAYNGVKGRQVLIKAVTPEGQYDEALPNQAKTAA